MKISVITVCRNPEKEFMLTAESVLAQDHDEVEWVVLDGLSWGGDTSLYELYRDEMDVFLQAQDKGVYHAMADAWKHASGDYVIFLNSGDVFYRENTLSEVASLIPEGSDIFYGNHVHVAKGVSHFQRPAAMSMIAGRLKEGNIGGTWHSGFPCHQATFYRRTLFSELNYDVSLRICADHDLMLRAFHAGKTINTGNVTVARYFGGGLSAQMLQRCFNEWATIYSAYSDYPHAVLKHFLGSDYSGALPTTNGVRIVGGLYNIEGPIAEFGNRNMAWVGDSGLQLVTTHALENMSIRVSGFAPWMQTFHLTGEGGVSLGRIMVAPGQFDVAIRLPEVLPSDSWLALQCEDIRRIGPEDPRRSGWAAIEIALEAVAPRVEIDPRSKTMLSHEIVYEVEGDPEGKWSLAGFGDWAENRTFRWLIAEHGTVFLNVGQTMWLDSLRLDFGCIDVPGFKEVEVEVFMDGKKLSSLRLSSPKRTVKVVAADVRIDAGSCLELKPSRRFECPGDDRKFSLSLYGIKLIGRVPSPLVNRPGFGGRSNSRSVLGPLMLQLNRWIRK